MADELEHGVEQDEYALNPEPSEAPKEVPTEQGELEDYDPEESPRDTVARILKRQNETESVGREGEQQKAKEKADGTATKDPVDKKAELDPTDFDPELLPPDRFSAKAKAAFNNSSKGVRREIHKAIKDLEAQYTRATQDARGAEKEHRHLGEVVQPYRDFLAESGFSLPVAVGKLLANHSVLVGEDKVKAVDKYVEIGNSLGIQFDKLAEYVKGGANNPGAASQNLDIENHPVVMELRQELKRVSSSIDEQVSAPITGQFLAVKHAVNETTGKLLYPELQNDNYLDSLKPRVLELLRTVPELRGKYGEALKRANADYKREVFGISDQAPGAAPAAPQVPRFPAANNNTQNRAVDAAVSVRGKTASVSSGLNGALEPPPEVLADARKTTAWVVEQQRLGRL